MQPAQDLISLSELLINCCDELSPHRESAWREFLKRYKHFIYQVITHRCLGWQVSRLRRQLSDVVNDVVSEVFIILTHSLVQYREVDNEKKFRVWLATVCNRATGRYLKREFFSEIVETDIEEFHNYIHGLEFDSLWELYESVIDQLRSNNSAKKRNLERDINIFQLYIWSDLSQLNIQTHPCYADIGHRVIDNIIHRLRAQLKEDKNNLT